MRSVMGSGRVLLEASARCDEQAAVSRRRTTSNAEQREPRCWLVWVSCLLTHRWPLARTRPGSCSQMAGSLHQSCWTPSLQTSPVTCHQPHFALDERRLYKNMRTAKRGAAGGPSGMTMEHWRPLLDSPKDLKLFFKMAESLARAEVPDAVIQTVRMGRMTALRKPSGGAVGATGSGSNITFSVRAVHTRRKRAMFCKDCASWTIITQSDLVSRAAMLDGLLNRVGGEALPFVRMFYGSPSSYTWDRWSGAHHPTRRRRGARRRPHAALLLFGTAFST